MYFRKMVPILPKKSFLKEKKNRVFVRQQKATDLNFISPDTVLELHKIETNHIFLKVRYNISISSLELIAAIAKKNYSCSCH